MSSATTSGAVGGPPAPGSAARKGGVSIELDVPKRVKDAYDQRVLEEWGRTATMASATLERELAAEFGEGPVTRHREEIDTLLETVGLPGREPPLPDAGADADGAVGAGEMVTVNYHVSEDLADQLRAEAARSDFRSGGDLLAAVMWRYACGDGALDRAREAISRANEAAEEQIDPETGKMERVPRIIIEGLRQRACTDGDELVYFTVDDFETVIEETAALKFSASRHARQTHLPSVLEELGFTWFPEKTGMFVDPDKFTIPETRDPRAKPTYLVDDCDRELAVRVAGYEAARESSRFAKLHTADVVAGVESLSNAIAAEYMRAAADGAPGYRYDAGARALKVNRSEVEAAREENDDVLEIAGGAETGPATATAPETSETDGGEASEEPDPPDRGGDGDGDTDEAAEVAAFDERMSKLEDAEYLTDGGAVTEPPASDVDVDGDGTASPPDPTPAADAEPDPDADRELPRLPTAICPTDGQILSADAHRDGRRWECPRCRQRWTPDRVFPDESSTPD